MAHIQQFFYVNGVKQFLPEQFEGRRVLEIGSLNINGSVRQFFQGCDYLGIDVGEGRDVDRVCKGQDFDAPAESFDTVITCEMMEHNPDWQRTWLNMLRVMRPDGLLIMTCASLGRRQHGTSEYQPTASPLTVTQDQNYYRNLVADDLSGLVNLDRWFSVHAFHVDFESHDLYFFGVGMNASPELRARAQALIQSLDRYYTDKNILGRY